MMESGAGGCGTAGRAKAVIGMDGLVGSRDDKGDVMGGEAGSEPPGEGGVDIGRGSGGGAGCDGGEG